MNKSYFVSQAFYKIGIIKDRYNQPETEKEISLSNTNTVQQKSFSDKQSQRLLELIKKMEKWRSTAKCQNFVCTWKSDSNGNIIGSEFTCTSTEGSSNNNKLFPALRF